MGTRADFDVSISPGARGTSFNCAGDDPQCTPNGALVEPSPGHPDGQSVFAFSATTPASGLQPEQANVYVQTFDNASGTAETTVKVAGFDANTITGQDLLVAYADVNTVTLLHEGVAYNVTLASGAISGQAAVAGSVFAIGSNLVDESSGTCRTLLYDSTTLRQTGSVNTCADQVANLEDQSDVSGSSSPILFTEPLTDGYFTLLSDTERVGKTYRLADAAPVPVKVNTSGPRSTIGLGWTVGEDQDIAAGSGLATYAVGTWAPGFSLPSAQVAALSLQIGGMSDNDIWLTTTSQSIVVDGTNGNTLLSSWVYKPDFGGDGWTVVDHGKNIGGEESSTYLVRYDGQLINALSSAPQPSN